MSSVKEDKLLADGRSLSRQSPVISPALSGYCHRSAYCGPHHTVCIYRQTRKLKLVHAAVGLFMSCHRNFLFFFVTGSPSLQVLRSRLKTERFARSYSCSD